jgi:Holliday junction resolvasome RuvABC DNA-binding subunit
VKVRAHVGTGADVPTLVRAVLDLHRRASQAQCTDEASTPSLAARALAQAGFSPTLARHAVEQARAHVGTEDLATLIREALRHCRE